MTLMRGYAGGCDLHTWLNDWIFPAEAKLDDRAVRAGADLALAELIASGVTTIADMYIDVYKRQGKTSSHPRGNRGQSCTPAYTVGAKKLHKIAQKKRGPVWWLSLIHI